jgi:signal transduction histidine kinase
MADTGRGIPAADLPHIFERFYRSDETRAGEGGSGLGLSIAKAFIESMHGRIEVVSAEGVGTRVTIILSGGV